MVPTVLRTEHFTHNNNVPITSLAKTVVYFLTPQPLVIIHSFFAIFARVEVATKNLLPTSLLDVVPIVVEES